MLSAEQKQKLSSLLAQEHVAVVTTHGDEWPTATMQAFAETDTLDVILIMLESAPKFLNVQKRPQVTLHIDTRDSGDIRSFQIIRAWIEGMACEVPRGSAEWESCKATFLKKNPFEEPFFQYDTLRMVRVWSLNGCPTLMDSGIRLKLTVKPLPSDESLDMRPHCVAIQS